MVYDLTAPAAHLLFDRVGEGRQWGKWTSDRGTKLSSVKVVGIGGGQQVWKLGL